MRSTDVGQQATEIRLMAKLTLTVLSLRYSIYDDYLKRFGGDPDGARRGFGMTR
jgi:hypothetical protein